MKCAFTNFDISHIRTLSLNSLVEYDVGKMNTAAQTFNTFSYFFFLSLCAVNVFSFLHRHSGFGMMLPLPFTLSVMLCYAIWLDYKCKLFLISLNFQPLKNDWSILTSFFASKLIKVYQFLFFRSHEKWPSRFGRSSSIHSYAEARMALQTKKKHSIQV